MPSYKYWKVRRITRTDGKVLEVMEAFVGAATELEATSKAEDMFQPIDIMVTGRVATDEEIKEYFS